MEADRAAISNAPAYRDGAENVNATASRWGESGGGSDASDDAGARRDVRRCHVSQRALSKLVKKVVLRRHGDRLRAEVTGNLQALLDLDEAFGNGGAGSPSRSLPNLRGGYVVA